MAYKILQKLISCFELRRPVVGYPQFTAECKEKFIKSGKKLHLKSLSEASDTLVLSCYKGRDVNASITISDITTHDVTTRDITPNAITMFFGCCGRDHVHRLCMATRDCFLAFFWNFTRQLAISTTDGCERCYRYSDLTK